MVLAVFPFAQRAARGASSAFPERSVYPRHASRYQRLLETGRIDVGGAGSSTPRCRPTRRANFDFEGLIQRGRRFQIQMRVRPLGLLGVAHRGGRALPGQPRLHYRRRATTRPMAVSASTTGSGRSQSRLEARRLVQRLGRRRPFTMTRAASVVCRYCRKFSLPRASRRTASFWRATTPRATARSARLEDAGPTSAIASSLRNQLHEGSSALFGPSGGVCSAHGSHQLKARPGHHLAPLKLSSGKNVFRKEIGRGTTRFTRVLERPRRRGRCVRTQRQAWRTAQDCARQLRRRSRPDSSAADPGAGRISSSPGPASARRRATPAP